MSRFTQNLNDYDFYRELSEEKRVDFFSYTEKKFMPMIDNIYYTVYIKRDGGDNPAVTQWINRLDELKAQCSSAHDGLDYGHGLRMELRGMKGYTYCLSEPDLFDIFISKNLANEGKKNENPRIVVQIRSLGLWTRGKGVFGANAMLKSSYERVEAVLSEYFLQVKKTRENRFDWANHTNIITNPDVTLCDRYLNEHVHTTLNKWKKEGSTRHTKDGRAIHVIEYYSRGSRKSDLVFARIYHKSREVIEMGYKGFMFKLWFDNGLISFYDKYCLEYALTHSVKSDGGGGNYDYIHKGRLAFYIEHGSDEVLKEKFAAALADVNKPLKEIEELANEYMPPVTVICNIEYETKRKFYYSFEKEIDENLTFEESPERVPALERLYKIVDNRKFFMNVLTSQHLAFVTHEKDENGNPIYCDWWKRLRSAKGNDIDCDVEALRQYSEELNAEIVKRRLINAVAAAAVYGGNNDSNYIEDISDSLALLNDNDKHNLKFSVSVTDENGEAIAADAAVERSEMLRFYGDKKLGKYKLLKNRIKKRDENLERIRREVEADVKYIRENGLDEESLRYIKLKEEHAARQMENMLMLYERGEVSERDNE